ncbi:MAG TPA: hypothetical protein VFH17_08355 [Coriobacteriia bacterium]|nr:hypothetical protein [Coriobacteriia bacterium]
MSTALIGPMGTVGGTMVGREQHGHYGQNRGHHDGSQNGRTRVHDEAIRELRLKRVSVQEIAEKVGVTTGTVLNVLKRLGMQGQKYRTRFNRKSVPGERISTIETALDEYDGLYIERADMPDGSDGYLVTINNEFPGMACSTVPAAIKSAIAALGERECTRGGRA